jgi:hypothetical protein
MEKQCSLLTSTLKTPETTAAFQECLQEVACGTSTHCYDALKLTFGNAINTIKQERQKIAGEQKVHGKEAMGRKDFVAANAEVHQGRVSGDELWCDIDS